MQHQIGAVVAAPKKLLAKPSLFTVIARQTENKSQHDLLAHIKEMSAADLIKDLEDGDDEKDDTTKLVESASDSVILAIIEKLSSAKGAQAKPANTWLINILNSCTEKRSFSVIHFLMMIVSPLFIATEPSALLAAIANNKTFSKEQLELLRKEIRNRVLFSSEPTKFLREHPEDYFEIGHLFLQHQSENREDAQAIFEAVSSVRNLSSAKRNHELHYFYLQLIAIYTKEESGLPLKFIFNIANAIEHLSDPTLLDRKANQFIGEWLTKFGPPLLTYTAFNDEKQFLSLIQLSPLDFATFNCVKLYTIGLKHLKKAAATEQKTDAPSHGDSKNVTLLQSSSFFETKQTVITDKTMQALDQHLQQLQDMEWPSLSTAFAKLARSAQSTEERKISVELATLKLRSERVPPKSPLQRLLIDDMRRLIAEAKLAQFKAISKIIEEISIKIDQKYKPQPFF